MEGKMKSRATLAVILLLCLVAFSNATAGETYFKFKIDSPDELLKLTRVISIDRVDDLEVRAYANERELAEFVDLGYSYEVLQHPGTLIQPKMSADKAGLRAWDSYPTYDAYVAMMNQFEIDYPLICDVVNVGLTVDGRSILFAKISDNVFMEEDEPEVMFTSSMHGDETTGYVLTLRLIDSLLASYGSDPRIASMVNSMEIWINPLANPDGTYAGGNSSVYGATRYNANSVDLNRNFPDPEDGQHPDGNSWQPETVAMMNLAEAHSFIISANFHGGIEVLNYPWDTWSRRHADDAWMIDVCRAYVDTVHLYSPSSYMDDLNNGITNGYDWYTISGGRQDYMTYWRGDREVTMEISNTKLLSASQLPAHWEYNKRSFLNWLECSLYGIRDIVTDAVSGDPVDAVITVLNHDIDSARVFTDPAVGDYHRMIAAGTWDLEFSALGYVTQTIQNVVVTDGDITELDVQLVPLSTDPVLSFVSHDAGAVNPGETVSMYITLTNDGGGDAIGVNATLASSDGYINITQPTSTYPPIPKLGGEATSNSNYVFEILPSCPKYHVAEFQVYITASGGFADTSTFSMTIGLELEDFEAGSFTSYPWTMSGNLPWTITSSNPYEGAYSAKSGAITHSQTSTMQVMLSVVENGNITFHYKVSSESGWDYLRFYIDGVQKGEWSGEVAWTEASYAVTAGDRTFKWTYSKDGSVSNGSDCGWIDYIVFPTVGVPVEITTTSLPDWTQGVPYSQQLLATGGSGNYTWSDPGGDLAGTGLSLSSSGLVSGTPTSEGTINFTPHVEDDGGLFDDRPLNFTINAAVFITSLSLPDGIAEIYYSTQIVAAGGTGDRTWSDLNGDLAGTGLTMTTTGIVAGTPSSAGAISFTAYVEDEVGSHHQKPFTIMIEDAWICGDCDGSAAVDIDDVTFLVAYIFAGGPAPDPMEVGDADCLNGVDIDDAVYLISYIFVGGPPPCEDCP
ncbi:MAG: M14 family zinc carboxypeptidase [Candidatus Zixiibacteriota bacterium]